MIKENHIILDEIIKTGVAFLRISKETGIPASRMYKWKEGKGTPKAEDTEQLRNWIAKFRNVPREKSYQEKRLDIKNGDRQEDLPVYYGNTRAGTIEIYSDDPEQQEPIGHLSSKIFPGCNHAEKINGDSMYPLAVNQGIAIGKIIDKKGFVWGEKYIIHTKHGGAVLKYVHPSEESKEFIKIVSHNKKIPPQEISMDDITFACRVYFIVNPS